MKNKWPKAGEKSRFGAWGYHRFTGKYHVCPPPSLKEVPAPMLVCFFTFSARWAGLRIHKITKIRFVILKTILFTWEQINNLKEEAKTTTSHAW